MVGICDQQSSSFSSAFCEQPNPLGSDAIQCMVRIWETAPLLNGRGVPTLAEADDISGIVDPYDRLLECLRSVQQGPRLEPGLRQWLPLWLHFHSVLPEMRRAVTKAIENLVVEHEAETVAWFQQCPAHIRKAYSSEQEGPSVQVLVIKDLANRLLVPLFHFVDDFGSDEPADTAVSAFEETQATCRALGVKFKEAKAQPASQHQLLGVSCV